MVDLVNKTPQTVIVADRLQKNGATAINFQYGEDKTDTSLLYHPRFKEFLNGLEYSLLEFYRSGEHNIIVNLPLISTEKGGGIDEQASKKDFRNLINLLVQKMAQDKLHVAQLVPSLKNLKGYNDSGSNYPHIFDEHNEDWKLSKREEENVVTFIKQVIPELKLKLGLLSEEDEKEEPEKEDSPRGGGSFTFPNIGGGQSAAAAAREADGSSLEGGDVDTSTVSLTQAQQSVILDQAQQQEIATRVLGYKHFAQEVERGAVMFERSLLNIYGLDGLTKGFPPEFHALLRGQVQKSLAGNFSEFMSADGKFTASSRIKLLNTLQKEFAQNPLFQEHFKYFLAKSVSTIADPAKRAEIEQKVSTLTNKQFVDELQTMVAQETFMGQVKRDLIQKKIESLFGKGIDSNDPQMKRIIEELAEKYPQGLSKDDFIKLFPADKFGYQVEQLDVFVSSLNSAVQLERDTFGGVIISPSTLQRWNDNPEEVVVETLSEKITLSNAQRLELFRRLDAIAVSGAEDATEELKVATGEFSNSLEAQMIVEAYVLKRKEHFAELTENDTLLRPSDTNKNAQRKAITTTYVLVSAFPNGGDVVALAMYAREGKFDKDALEKLSESEQATYEQARLLRLVMLGQLQEVDQEKALAKIGNDIKRAQMARLLNDYRAFNKNETDLEKQLAFMNEQSDGLTAESPFVDNTAENTPIDYADDAPFIQPRNMGGGSLGLVRRPVQFLASMNPVKLAVVAGVGGTGVGMLSSLITFGGAAKEVVIGSLMGSGVGGGIGGVAGFFIGGPLGAAAGVGLGSAVGGLVGGFIGDKLSGGVVSDTVGKIASGTGKGITESLASSPSLATQAKNAFIPAGNAAKIGGYNALPEIVKLATISNVSVPISTVGSSIGFSMLGPGIMSVTAFAVIVAAFLPDASTVQVSPSFSTDIVENKYISVVKTPNPAFSQDPTAITYTILITKKDNPAETSDDGTIIISEITDVISVVAQNNVSVEPPAINPEDLAQLDSYKPENRPEEGPYILTSENPISFQMTVDASDIKYADSLVRNIVTVKFTVSDVPDEANGGAQTCFGDCPQAVVPPCWPVEGRVSQLPRGLSGSIDNPVLRTSCIGNESGHCYANEFHPNDSYDIGVGVGNPIYAVADGEIIYSDWYQGGASGISTLVDAKYGNLTVIDHGTFFSYYAHQSSFVEVKGAFVSGGQIIGKSGHTGNSTAPHLHYEILGLNEYVLYQALHGEFLSTTTPTCDDYYGYNNE